MLTDIQRELQNFFESPYSRLLVVGSQLSTLKALGIFALTIQFVSFRGFRHHR